MAQQKRDASPREDAPGEQHRGTEVRTALISGNTFHARAVQYAVVDGLAIFEGDIVLGTAADVAQRTEQLRQESSGQIAMGVVITGAQYRWPNCTIPYTIDSTLPNTARVTDAIAHWQANTRYTFVARSSETDYVTFRPSSGCSSSVGRQGGQQFVNLGPNCSTGNAIHEIGHTVGLWHEQSRSDRDSFVTIHWDKIQAGMEHNFDQHITDGDDIGVYDYGSIMHYPRDAFSIDGSDTITPVNPGATIGQRTALSAGDIAAANSLCPAAPPTIKENAKDQLFDTRKEQVKDIRLDTRKEIITDTRKEQILDTRKETIKDVAFDPPWGKSWVERPDPFGRFGLPGQLRPAGEAQVPFAVATPHRAPAAEIGTGEIEAAVAGLDAQLADLAEQLAYLDAAREALQAQYDETAKLLKEAAETHDRASGA